MKVPLKWLREYTPAAAPVADLASRLTMSGIEVADVYHLGEAWDRVYVGEVVALARHPNADRLQLATVAYGAERPLTVVTGAPNLSVGDKVPLALIGARLIDVHANPPEPRELKPVKLRGIVSEGMVCSARELGLGEDHAGILILDRAARPGALLAEQLGDVVLDLDVTPNRVDCFSVIGIARQVAALLQQPLTIPEATYPENGPPIGTLAAVTVADADLCPRYQATVIQGITIGPSPKWLQDRLTAAGLRPINNVVDVTNYVMLEWGQPLHAFDYDKLRRHQVVVRRASEGERLTLLDGSTRTLAAGNLVIADPERAVGIAGVMGGADSEVTDGTHAVLLESANFNPLSVRRTARELKLLTDAAHRFERGLPPGLTEPAIRRAVQLILTVVGGKAAQGLIDVYPRPVAAPEIFLTPAEVQRLLGIRLTVSEIVAVLARSGCQSTPVDGGLQVVPPLQRTDLVRPADLCEEIATLIGYDQIPSTLPSGRPPEPTINEAWQWREDLRQLLTGLGLTEIVTYALTSPERLARLQGVGTNPGVLPDELSQRVTDRFLPLDVPPLEIVNPLSRESDVLRTTVFGSMLETVGQNLRVADRDVLLFEFGNSYLRRTGDLPEQQATLAVGAGAWRSGPQWGRPLDNDFFWLKGVAEAVLEQLGLRSRVYRPLRHPLFHPGRAAAVLVPGPKDDGASETLLGVLGEVAPDVRAAFDLDQPAFLLGLSLDAALPLASRTRTVVPVPRFPSVVQDLAVVLPSSVAAWDVENLIREAGTPLLKTSELFDIYQGPPIPDGKISLAYHLTYQAPDRTLTDREVAEVQSRIEAALVGQLGAELRR